MVRMYWFDPVDELKRVENRVDSVLKDVFEDPSYTCRRHFPGRVMEEITRATEPCMGVDNVREPHIDIVDDEDKLTVIVDLPGVRKEDIKVDIKSNVLEITAECKEETDKAGKEYIRRERAYSRYKRCIHLPTEIDSGKTKAIFREGVLELALPKTDVERVKNIEVE